MTSLRSKVVTAKGSGETLVDSARVGDPQAGISLSPDQYRTLVELAGPIHAVRYAGGGWLTMSGDEVALPLCPVTPLGSEGDLGPEGSQLLYPLTFGGQMLGVLRLSAQRPGHLLALDIGIGPARNGGNDGQQEQRKANLHPVATASSTLETPAGSLVEKALTSGSMPFISPVRTFAGPASTKVSCPSEIRRRTDSSHRTGDAS